MKKLTTAMALFAGTAFAQDVTITPKFKETSKDLVSACTDYSTKEGQQKCIEQIAIETHQSYIDYIDGMNGNVSAFFYGSMVTELNAECDLLLRNKKSSIKSPDFKTAINSMNDYTSHCLTQQINTQSGQFWSIVGDFNIDMSNVPFHGNRLELIDTFRILAVGEAIPEHEVRLNNEEAFQAYKKLAAPAFTK